MNPARHLIAILSLVYITINLFLGVLPLLVLATLKLIVPHQGFKTFLYRLMLAIYVYAVKVDNILLQRLLGIRFDVNGLEGMDPTRNYLVISNHRSWADILVLQSLLIRGAPIIKFIVKSEIVFIPLVGLICWAYEYPFVKRQSLKDKSRKNDNRKRDLQTIDAQLAVLGKHPTTIINFLEGTRFSLVKSKKHNSPHRHLLKAKAGGLSYILKTFGSQIDTVLDFTLAYDAEEPVFWKFLGGACKQVKVDVRHISMETLLAKMGSQLDNISYEDVSNWLTSFWEEKDQKMERFYKDFRKIA